VPKRKRPKLGVRRAKRGHDNMSAFDPKRTFVTVDQGAFRPTVSYVIDLCSGDGWFTLQIAKIARHVSAIDIDPTLLEVARHQLVESGVANCELIAGDAYDIAKLAGPTDFVFMANAFHGVPDRARFAKAVGAALKSNSRFAIVNWHKRPRDETPILGEPRGPTTELRMSTEDTIKSVEAGELKFSEMVDYHPITMVLSLRILACEVRRAAIAI
jgi:SAM-dependent methyltransferase